MPSISKKKNDETLRAKGIARKSWSRREFCARNGISEGLYEKLKRLGIGPDETLVLDRILITTDAEDRWLRKNKRKVASAKAEAASEAANVEA
jgi:hypothetical protein